MDLSTHIIFEDQDLVVLNKPPGIVVNEADTVRGDTVQAWFREYLSQVAFPKEWQSLIPQDFSPEFGTPEAIYSQRSGIVHRLDKHTSGVLLLAKHPGSLVALLKLFRDRRVSKIYECLTHGKFSIEKDVISLPLGRSPKDRQQFAVVAEGRTATTEYQVQEFFPHFNLKTLEKYWPEIKYRATQGFRKKLSSYQGFSLVRCHPITGRTHQIRVHLAHSKHPIVGDEIYVGKKRAKLDSVWCQRQFLHAATLTLRHLRTQQEQTFTAPLPDDLQRALEFVRE